MTFLAPKNRRYQPFGILKIGMMNYAVLTTKQRAV
jgi:hypothetical protein